MMTCLFAVFVLFAPQQDRIQALEGKLVAPCCWNESVKDHGSPTAAAMRAEIVKLVGEGKSDVEILAYYRQRYGQRVLIEPEGNTLAIAILAPIVIGFLGLLFVVRHIRRLRIRPAGAG